jgi:ribosomal protein L24E
VPPAHHPDTVVPEGIHLECVLDNHTAKCHWSGSAVDGFAKVLVLRSDGRVVFMSEDPAASEYADVDLAPGSYSWIVVTIDAHGKALVHSNRVALEIGAAG